MLCQIGFDDVDCYWKWLEMALLVAVKPASSARLSPSWTSLRLGLCSIWRLGRGSAAGGWTEPREIRVTASQPASPEQMVDYVGSMSWVAALPEDQRAETLAKVDAIISAGETPTELPIHVAIGLSTLT